MASGEPLYLILHVEIQVSRESGFPQRMFVYYYRLYDIYPEQVVSLAILADEEPGWKPRRYKHTQRHTHLMFGFRTVKLWEYDDRWAEPEEMAKSFRERVEEIDQETKMKYVTSIERLYLKEGREEGLLNGMRLTALTLFEEKFGPLDASIRSRVEKAGRDQILLWTKRILTASSLDEVLAT